jgi:chromosome segregation ATPase
MNWFFGNIDRDSIKMPADEYFGIVREIERLTKENENLKHLNENQFNMIMDLRNEITDLKKQKEGLCELVGKTKKDCENLCAGYSELVNTNTQYVNEIRKLKRKLDAGCNTCPDMENTKKKNDELKELIDFKKNQIEEQANTIRDLDKKLTELRAAAKESAERIEVLNDSIGQLRRAITERDEGIKYWADKAHNAQRRIAEMIYKGDSDASEAVLKDADAKIQSANDKAANAKKEAKQAKETAERYREENFVLHRQIDQFKKLNDELIKELARQQNAELIMEFDRKGE